MSALARRRTQVPTPVHSVSAEDPFSRFPKFEKVLIREPSRKDRLERLRELRDSLNSGNLTSEQILNRMRFYKNLTMFEAIALAEKEGKLLAPNIVHDRVLNQTGAKYLSWTGTLVIYEKSYQPFGTLVRRTWSNLDGINFSLYFQTPVQFQGRVNCALVIEHPDFTFVKTDENTYEVKLTKGAVVHLVEGFPNQHARFYAQNKLGIPYGGQKCGPDARSLLRTNEAYIGPVVRDHEDIFGSNNRTYIILNFNPAVHIRVAFI